MVLLVEISVIQSLVTLKYFTTDYPTATLGSSKIMPCVTCLTATVAFTVIDSFQ